MAGGGNIANARLNSVPCTNVFLTENILEKLLASRDNAFTSIGTAGTGGATTKDKRRGMQLFNGGKTSQTNTSGACSTFSGVLGLGREVRPHASKKKHKNVYDKKLHGQKRACGGQHEFLNESELEARRSSKLTPLVTAQGIPSNHTETDGSQ